MASAAVMRYGRPAGAPTATMIVPSCLATAARLASGSRNEDGRALRRIELLARHREHGVTGQHDIQLLVPVGARARLVVLLDDLACRPPQRGLP